MSRTTTVIVFLLGLVLGSFLSRPVSAQRIQLIYATRSGAAKALVTDSSGNLNVVAN